MTIEITGQQATVSVGEKIKLGVKFNVGWGILESVEWKIPGTIVKNYVDGQTSAKVTKTEEADKKKFTIEFYWVDGGDGRTVEAACVFRTMAGTETKKTVSAKFDVKRPKLDKFTSVTDRVGLTPTTGSPTHLKFGVSKAGIEWKWKIDSNGAAQGKIKDIQLILSNRRETIVDPSGVNPLGINRVETLPGRKTPSGIWMLDSENPYGSAGHWRAIGGPWPLLSGGSASDTGVFDSPGMGLSSNRKRVSFDDQFVYFIMYQSDKLDSIWVPIGKLPWSCKGTATKGLTSWSVTVGSTGNSIAPSGSETLDFPEWSNIEPDHLSWEVE